MMGYSFQELMSKPFIEFVHPEDQARVLENYLKRLEGRELPKVYTFRAIDKWGFTKWLEINATRIQWEGRPATLNFLSDVTERVQMEEEIRRKEEYFRSLIENSTDVIFILDKMGIIKYTSPSSSKVLGYPPEELLEGRGLRYIHPDDASSVRGVIQRVTDEPSTTLGMEFRFRHRDGSWRMMEGFARNLLHVPSIQGIVVNVRDITEQRAAEQEIDSLQEQFRQSQKMEAIGRLAGGIAHDFNNLLSIIQGYSDLSLLSLEQGDPLRENIEQIQRASRKAADLTRKLLAFSRRQVMEMRVLDLNLLLKNLEKMLRRLIGEDIELSILQGEGLGRVKADPGQLEQVILNLVVNARDAMPSGGKLTIETANVKLDEAYARAHIAVKSGDYVLLSISDTGEGMTPEIRERIFEPFFTTKQKGTGLGLSTVYGIVKQSGGNIWVYSEPGRGTSFKIYLPRVDEPLEETREVIGEENLPKGNETVLVVEDEEEVRKIAMEILRRQGYKVLEAPQGGDAFLICEKYDGPIHLMLTDVVMPRMDGIELAQRLLSMRPEMRVIYMSGYADNAIHRHGFFEEGVDYIQKPFTVSGLARKVREVLDKDKKN
jgi:PAS domain S-box-containing protein